MKISQTQSGQPASQTLPNSKPIFKKGNDVGFLFIHGFTGTTFEGQELADRMHGELGVTISVPLLPGHGTTPEHLKGIKWEEWYFFVRQKFLELRNQCAHVFICGQSMGASLVLHLASHHKVTGVISLAGAVFLKDWRLKFLPIARNIIPYHHKSKGPDVRNKALKHEIPCYRKYPVKSVDELLNLLEHTRQDLPEITAPALLFHSSGDRTISPENLSYIHKHIGSQTKIKVELNQSYHVISLDVEKEQIFQHIRSFVKDNCPSEILLTGK